jgi:hypothetical protein
MRYSLLLVGLLVALSGCRGRKRGTAAGDAKGVGFELPGAAHVERGAIITMPPGREEAFLSFVAGQAPGWVDACLGETGEQTVEFGFETGDKGALGRLASDPGRNARERCLTNRAVASTATALPEKTSVKVQLAIRSGDVAR